MLKQMPRDYQSSILNNRYVRVAFHLSHLVSWCVCLNLPAVRHSVSWGRPPLNLHRSQSYMLRSLMFHGRSFCMHHFYVFVSTNDPLSSSSPYFVQQRGLAHPPPPSLIRLHQIIQAQGKSMTGLVFVSVLFRRLEHETTTSD